MTLRWLRLLPCEDALPPEPQLDTAIHIFISALLAIGSRHPHQGANVVCVDSMERPAGQPGSATLTLHADAPFDLLAAAAVEAADPHLPDGWRDRAALMVAARLAASGLRVGVSALVRDSTVTTPPAPLEGVRNR